MTGTDTLSLSGQLRTASSILQDWLDVVSGALLAGDLDVLHGMINLPYKRQTLDAVFLTETQEQLDDDAMRITEAMNSMGVNHFIRIAGTAEFLSDDYIEGHYVTHTLCNATPVLPTFNSKAVLRRFGQTWKLVDVFNEYANRRWPAASMSVPSQSDLHTCIPNSDARREAGQPQSLYKAFLEHMDAVTNASDFDAFCNFCDFPVSLHSESWDLTASKPDEIGPWFGSVAKYLSVNGNMQVVRKARNAEFIGPATLCGYHDTCFDAGGAPVPNPIPTRMILKRVSTDWFVQSITMAIASDNYKAGDPIVLGDLITANEISKRTRT